MESSLSDDSDDILLRIEDYTIETWRKEKCKIH